MKHTLLLTFLLSHCLTGSATSIPENIQTEANNRVKHDLNPGIALAYNDGGETVYAFAGVANLNNQTPLTQDAVFEIGSITKTMTALLLADAVVKKDATLEQSIMTWLPDQPSQGSAQINLKQLATHSSGLPRLPGNMTQILSPDPYAEYDRDDLLTALAEQRIKPDQQHYSYSNYGAGLLGELMAIRYQKDFQSLLTERVFKPLGMDNSYADAAQVPLDLKVTGYSGKYEVPHWHFKALAGAGSVNSSIKDLMTYGLAILKADHPELKEAIQLSTGSHYEQQGLTLGLGWHIHKGVLWHNGGTAGFRSMLMIDPLQNKVAAGITNQAEHDVEDLVRHLIWPEAPLREHDFPVAINPESLRQYQGQFHNAKVDKTIKTAIKGDHLMIHFPNQPAYRLIHIGNHQFKMKLTQSKVKFQHNEQGQIEAMNIHAFGGDMVYQLKQ